MSYTFCNYQLHMPLISYNLCRFHIKKSLVREPCAGTGNPQAGDLGRITTTSVYTLCFPQQFIRGERMGTSPFPSLDWSLQFREGDGDVFEIYGPISLIFNARYTFRHLPFYCAYDLCIYLCVWIFVLFLLSMDIHLNI